MADINRDWFSEVDKMFKETERLLGHLSASKPPPSHFSKYTFVPHVDICETEDAVVVIAELAGVREEDIELSISDRLLTISGERKDLLPGQQKTYDCMEIYLGRFQRTLTLPVAVDPEKSRATYKDGILIVEMPRLGATREIKLQIRSKL